MTYLVLLIVSDEKTLVKLEYFINEFREDVKVLKAQSLVEGLRILKEKPIDVLITETSIESDEDGYEIVYDLRNGGYERLPVIFLTSNDDLAFQLKLFKNTKCIDCLTHPLEQAEFQDALDIALKFAVELEQGFFVVPQGKSSIPVDLRTFLYAEIRKGESKIDVYHCDHFAGEKWSECLSEISVKKFLNYAEPFTNSIAQCYRGVVVNKKKIRGYDGKGNLIIDGNQRVPLGDTYESEFIDFIKTI